MTATGEILRSLPVSVSPIGSQRTLAAFRFHSLNIPLMEPVTRCFIIALVLVDVRFGVSELLLHSPANSPLVVMTFAILLLLQRSSLHSKICLNFKWRWVRHWVGSDRPIQGILNFTKRKLQG